MDNEIVFKGIVEEIGVIWSIGKVEDGSGKYVMKIQAQDVIKGLKNGDKMAVNGVCMSIVDVNPPYFTVHIWLQTQSKTNLMQLRVGDQVNLERNRSQEINSSLECPY